MVVFVCDDVLEETELRWGSGREGSDISSDRQKHVDFAKILIDSSRRMSRIEHQFQARLGRSVLVGGEGRWRTASFQVKSPACAYKAGQWST